MTTITDKAIVPYENPQWVPVLPTRWVAEYDGEVAGGIDRTPRGRYRATNRHGRRIGSFRTLDEARERLELNNSATRIQRFDQSRVLLVGGLIAFLATAGVAAFGVMSLLAHQ
ncbi:hypothetical protein GCM10022239_22660 [Leifsonia bigeumensis]|uniref:Uncharacterized protein n=1 Tax=Leifsonella bigeumensis TaxID=433643 RepID=A0ABP7FTF6_9MICO